MREFIKNVLSKLVEVEGETPCLNELLNANGKNTSRTTSEISRFITNGRSWSKPIQRQLSSTNTYRFILDCLKSKNHLALFKDTRNELDKRAQQTEAAPLLILFQQIEVELNNVNLDMQKKLVATGIHSLLCFLISNGFLSDIIRDNEVQLFIEQARRKKGDSGRASSSEEPNEVKETDIAQIVFENSKDMYKKVLKDYEPNPDLCPKLSGEIKKHTLIVSDGGAGKTTWMYNHWEELLEMYETDANHARIPIYIQLNTFDGSNTNNPSTGSFIKSHITQYYVRLQQVNPITILNQIKPEQYVLLLDAINEAKNSDALMSEIEELKNAGFGIILTSRRKLNWDIRNDFSIAALERFSEEHINQVLRKNRLPAATGRLLTTLDRPMFLSLFLGLGIEAKGLVQPGELFLAHHQWIKKMFSPDKHGPAYQKQGERLLTTVLPDIATQVKSMVFCYTEVEETVKTPGCNSYEALAILCETGIIIDDGYDEYEATNVYRWKHEFFLQFYQAMRIWQRMGYSTENRTFQPINTLPHELFQKEIDDYVLVFLGDVLEAQFEKKTSITQPMSPIEKWLQDNCRSQAIAVKQHTTNEIQICTANLIRTMILTRDGHLEHTVFTGLDLQYVEFFDCWLTGSAFEKCRSINMGNFCAAGHDYPPDSFAISTKQNLLFSSSKDERCVLIWDLSINRICKTLSFIDKVASITISPDEKWLAVVLYSNPFSIVLLDLGPSIEDWGTSRKIFRTVSDDILQKMQPGHVFFDSQSQCLFYLLSIEGVCKCWDILSEVELPEFSLSVGSKESARAHADKHCICSATDRLYILRDSDIGVYNIRKGIEETTINLSDIIDMCVTPSGDRLVARKVTTKDSCIYINGLTDDIADYSISSQNISKLFNVVTTEYAVCASCPKEDELYIWHFSNKELEPIIIQGIEYKYAYAVPNSDVIVCASNDTNITIINLSSKKRTLLRGHGTSNYSTNVHFTKAKDILMRRYEDGNVFLLDIKRKTSSKARDLSRFLNSQHRMVWEYKFDGQHLFLDQKSGDVAIWDVLNDEYMDTIPGTHEQSITDISVVGEKRDMVVTESGDMCFSAWKMPGHQLLGRIDKSVIQSATKEVRDIATPVHTVRDWNDCSVSAYCFLPERISVAVGYHSGSIRVWDIITGHYFEEKISNGPVHQICPIPRSSYICIVTKDGIVSVYDVSEKSMICQWDASENLYRITGHTLTEDNHARMEYFSIRPVTKDISIVDYGLGLHELTYYFVKHFENGIQVGDNIFPFGQAEIVSQNGNTLIKPCWGTFFVYDIPFLIWHEKKNTISPRAAPHYDVSPDGEKLLCAFQNGDIIVYGAHDQTEFTWPKGDVVDLTECNFHNATNINDDLKDFLRMNNAIL